METPSDSTSVRQTAASSRPRPLARGAWYSTTRLRTGVSSIIAANSLLSMSAMPPLACRASR